MHWILLSVGFLVLSCIVLWYIADMKKTLKNEMDDFKNANSTEEIADIKLKT